MPGYVDRCAKCGKTFTEWSWFNKHISTDDCIGVHKMIPVRTTTRTKSEIVRDVELSLGNLVINYEYSHGVHSPDCRCHYCQIAFINKLHKGD